MRVLFNHQCLLFAMAVILTVYTLCASAVPAKDHKNKLLEKLRNSLNQTELEEAADVTLETAAGTGAAVAGAAENVTAEVAPEAKAEEETADKTEDDAKEVLDDDTKLGDADKDGNSTDLKQTEDPASYLLNMRTLLKSLFDMFGYRLQSKKKEGRMLNNDDSYSFNGLKYEYFKDDIRTTVGAVLGEKECIQKIVCGAGSYLRDVNGKHVILTILENVTPSAWTDTMELLKKSAVTDGDCVYKCLEAGHADDDNDK